MITNNFVKIRMKNMSLEELHTYIHIHALFSSLLTQNIVVNRLEHAWLNWPASQAGALSQLTWANSTKPGIIVAYKFLFYKLHMYINKRQW